MSTPIITVFVLVLLVIQMANIFGKLTTLCGPTHHAKRKVVCFSEDDGSALVWNTDITYKYYPSKYIIESDVKEFSKTCTLYGIPIDCKLDNNQSCMKLWNREHWTLTTSIDRPMGLVFDQRWEAFEEYKYHDSNIYDIILLNTSTIILPFSVRAEADIHFSICNGRYETNLCYSVIISGWENTIFFIRKCPKGLPSVGKHPQDGSKCTIERAFRYHRALSAHEWRSYLLMWNSETRNISLYDSDQLIVTYRDMNKYNIVHFNSKMFFRSYSLTLVRYHNYNYLYTSTQNANLTSNTFFVYDNYICLQMLIGLCAECDAVVSLRTSDNEILQDITVNGSSVAAVHGLPMWQSVKITANIVNGYNNFQIVVTPKLNLYNSNPVWSIANVRTCSPNECTRNSAVYLYKDYDNWSSNEGFWPNVTCQKLFYKEQSVVNVLKDTDLNKELDDKNCPLGYIGPGCNIQCNYTLETKTDCKSVVICNNNGCTCTSGYRGPLCDISCSEHFYGYACKKRCGSCFLNKQCDNVSGVCHNGCQNTENYIYIPPLCQIGIRKPNEIQIVFINQTTIIATIPIKWEEYYEETVFLYTFEIKTREEKFINQHEWKRISQNSTRLLNVFNNLKSGTIYEIRCVFTVNQELLYGDWKTVETDCDSITNFDVTSDETSLKIVMEKNKNQLHPCPINLYDVLLKRNDNQDERKMSGSILSFPYTLSNLNLYTSYNATTLIREKKVFSRKVRAPEAVPSEVLHLQALPLSSTSVSLFWVRPWTSNGIIKKYTVYLTIAEYFGCKNMESPFAYLEYTNKTEITILGLHAYAKYNVSVTAHNSWFSSKPTMTTFKLNASVIPAVTFSHLKIENWNLSWSPPKDCRSILGPLTGAQIEIQGISEAVRNFSVTWNTKHNFINLEEILYGGEKYVAKIFALRSYGQLINTSAYEKYEFDTPPKAPPEITNLEVVEVENRETIHLRWLIPRPPLNGILHGYDIMTCTNGASAFFCNSIQVHLNETCDLWDNYMCKSIRYTNDYIQVVAYNVGVSRRSPPANVTMEMLRNTTPDPPSNVTFILRNNSVIDFKWLHPWKSGGHIRCFRIIIKEMSSTLRNRSTQFSRNEIHDFPVTNYLRNYSLRLYLLPSTQYKIFIETVTVTNETSKANSLEVQTPSSIDISGELEVSTQEFDWVILLHIPKVLNDTRNSVTYIGIIEHDICQQRVKIPKDLLVQAGEKRIEYVTQVAKNSTDKLTGQIYTIENNNSTDCPLNDGELYEIMVIVTECDSFGERFILTRKTSFYFGGRSWIYRSEMWIIYTILIAVAVCAAFYFYKK